jgi:transcriptional regulator with XRE-family HTH domain
MKGAELFAGRLRSLRESKGWTQAYLAEQAGLTREGVAQLETGRRKPAWGTVIALSSALGTDCRSFLEGEVEPPAKRGPGRPRKSTPSVAKKTR